MKDTSENALTKLRRAIENRCCIKEINPCIYCGKPANSKDMSGRLVCHECFIMQHRISIDETENEEDRTRYEDNIKQVSMWKRVTKL